MFEGWAGEEQRVALTLYTDAYVVRGSLTTRQHRLSDILNLADEDFLVLADATFERFGRRGSARHAAFAQVNLAAVLFAVADSTVEAVPELRTPKVTETALISIPPFEIIGRIHLLPDRDLRQALQELTGRFVPVTDATYGSDPADEAPRTAPMVADTHARAQILSPFGDGAVTTAPAASTQEAEPDAEEPGRFNPEGRTPQDLDREDLERDDLQRADFERQDREREG
jgi:ribosomal protein L12E/L44/L45/RPP1/RPP2